MTFSVVAERGRGKGRSDVAWQLARGCLSGLSLGRTLVTTEGCIWLVCRQEREKQHKM